MDAIFWGRADYAGIAYKLGSTTVEFPIASTITVGSTHISSDIITDDPGEDFTYNTYYLITRADLTKVRTWSSSSWLNFQPYSAARSQLTVT